MEGTAITMSDEMRRDIAPSNERYAKAEYLSPDFGNFFTFLSFVSSPVVGPLVNSSDFRSIAAEITRFSAICRLSKTLPWRRAAPHLSGETEAKGRPVPPRQRPLAHGYNNLIESGEMIVRSLAGWC